MPKYDVRITYVEPVDSSQNSTVQFDGRTMEECLSHISSWSKQFSVISVTIEPNYRV